jgi:formate hydrogenlyase transcriptional activator
MVNESCRMDNDHARVLIERYRALLEVTESIARYRNLADLLRELAECLPRVVLVNFLALSLYDPHRNVMRLHTIQANVPADFVGGHEDAIEKSPAGLCGKRSSPSWCRILLRSIVGRRFSHSCRRTV